MPNCCSSPSSSAFPPAASAPPRPRGLWKARATSAPREKILPSQKRTHPEASCSHHHHPPPTHPADLLDPLDDRLSAYDSDSSVDSRTKRRRLASDTPPTSEDDVLYWDYSRKCSPHPERLSKWVTRSKVMDTTTTAGPGVVDPAAPSHERATCDMEDWEDLKELFAKAAEIYENQPPSEAILLLRGVIHECHRFMRMYYDPSIIYATPAQPEHAPKETPPEQRLIRDWLADRPPLYPPKSEEKERLAKARSVTEEAPKKCKCKDLSSAFYTILGTTLFFFGNLIDQDPSLAAEGEPSTPIPYWLSAVDVFEIGENLPVRTNGRGCPSAPEDWRMAIVWGRTLVALTHEALARQKDAEPTIPDADPMARITAAYSFTMPATGPFGPPIGGVPLSKVGTPDEPNWPPGSPFALIVERRLPRTSRMSLSNTSPDEMMLIAKDQFSRGIFHMPHPLHHSQRSRKFPGGAAGYQQQQQQQTKALPAVFTCTPPLAAFYSSTAGGGGTATPADALSTAPADTDADGGNPATGSTPPPTLIPGETFSRAKELFTIASEVLDVAERFPSPSSRAALAGFADGVLSQMKMEANTEHAAAYGGWAGAGAIVLARGRANLVVGAAKAEEIEERLEDADNDEGVWECDEALDGREALGVAVVYLEKAREALVAKRDEEARERERDVEGGQEVIMVESVDGEDYDDIYASESPVVSPTFPTSASATAAVTTTTSTPPTPTATRTNSGSNSNSNSGPPLSTTTTLEHSTEETITEIGTMLAEALITLANLTKDEKEREALYAQAQREAGDVVMFDGFSDDEEDGDGMSTQSKMKGDDQRNRAVGNSYSLLFFQLHLPAPLSLSIQSPDLVEFEGEESPSSPLRWSCVPPPSTTTLEHSTEETITEIGTMLAEALITLANLTKDEKEREALYAQAQREAGDVVMLDWFSDDDEEDGDGMRF
ncbi:hypothetical protein BDN70DRAFT_918668 [Pholiota conissans]|uniref:Uncharacterized protein n=1 Tax=Pholiota conissans TaxID=109636 RepID=A0A9P5Z7G5_9AGAR|nr:hypothetical protein BDN70DRAFT_918668 [Pholiota conissans]